MQRYTWQSLVEKSCIVTFLALTGVALLPGHQALAQVTPDNTLGTQVNINNNNGSITGGTQRGTALFHSFSSFSISAGDTFTFQDQGVATIFSRVTGSAASNINGVLEVTGTADLFFLNPNGILFGPNSALNVGGSFVATTASSIEFPGGGEFSTDPNRVSSSFLPVTVDASVPVGLRFGDRPPAMIANSGYLYTGQNLSLVGGSVVSDGRLGDEPQNEVTLVATGAFDGISNIQMHQNGTLLRDQDGSLIELPTNSLSSRIITISPPETALSPILSNVRAGDIVIHNSAIPNGIEIRTATLSVNASNDLAIENSLLNTEVSEGDKNSTLLSARNNIYLDNTTLIGGIGDPIIFRSANQIVINDSLVNIPSTNPQNALDFSIQSTGETALVNSRIQSSNNSSGNGGNVNFNVGSLRVVDYRLGENSIFSFADGTGNGGVINIHSRGPISFEGPGATIRSQASSGSTGSVSIVSENGDISFNSNFISPRGLPGSPGIYTSTGSSNRDDISTGSVSIIAKNGDINLQNNVQVRTDAGGNRNAGNISLQANNGQVNLINGANLIANTFGEGSGGRIFVEGSEISSRSQLETGQPSETLGNGGDILLQANQISIENGQIVATTQLQGNGGTIRLNSPGNITLSSGASLNASTFGSGAGGNINVNVPSDPPNGATLTSPGVRAIGQNVTLSSGSTINAGTSGTGLGGNVQVGAGGILRVDNSTVTVSSTGSPINNSRPGDAGTLRTNSGYVQLDNGQLAATSVASNGGNIDMAVDNVLLLRNGSRISTQSDGPQSQDGNIAIQSGGIVAIPQENSDIIARSSRRGNVEIETQAIIGIAINQGVEEIPTISEILSTGDTVLNLGIDPSQGIQELEQEPGDVELAQGCNARNRDAEAEYIDIGQGGQAASPDDSLNPGTLQADWVDLESAGVSNGSAPSAAQQAAPSSQPTPTCP